FKKRAAGKPTTAQQQRRQKFCRRKEKTALQFNREKNLLNGVNAHLEVNVTQRQHRRLDLWWRPY
ncbi:hypothetical protein TYRP_009046, partial [Tyrophagus putrescentiae]